MTTMTVPYNPTPGSLYSGESKTNKPGVLPPYIDSSMLSSWRSCRRKFYWNHVHSLHPDTGKSVHLVAGGAFAAGMEAARRLVFQGPGDHQPLHDDLLQAAFKAFLGSWGNYIPPDDTPKTFVNTFSALDFYLAQYPPATDVLKPMCRSDGSPAVEYTFAIPLEEGPKHPETGDPFLFVGRFDLLGEYNGLPCIADEKTTYAISTNWANMWNLRGQFMGYCWACQQNGIKVNTAIIRGIGIQKTQFKIATAIAQYPQYLIDRWYRLLLHDLREIAEAYEQVQITEGMGWNINESLEHWYPQNFSDACTSYNSPCAYTPLCMAKDPESFLTNYTASRWDPLNK